MLVMHPEAQSHLVKVCDYMSALDSFGSIQFQIEPHFRAELDARVSNLTNYGCRGSSDGVPPNPFSCGVFMHTDRGLAFNLTWRQPHDGTLQLPMLEVATPELGEAQWLALQQFYSKISMVGGLIFHGHEWLKERFRTQPWNLKDDPH